MLSPFILIGVGGSGGKTLRAVRQKLEMKLRLAGWKEGLPDAWQFLHFDTPITQDGLEFPAPFLPQTSYIGLAAAHGNYPDIISAIKAPLNKSKIVESLRQLPDPAQVNVPVYKGAGQYRGVGRAVALARLKQIGEAAANALAKAKAPDSMATLNRLSTLLGSDSVSGVRLPRLLFVSSIAGGSGAGQYLDVVDAVKAKFSGADNKAWENESFAILYAPDVFDGIKGAEGIPSNALATISETVSGHANEEVNDSVRAMYEAQGIMLPIQNASNKIGVNYPLVVGRQNATTSYKGQHDVYLSIASTISAWMSNEVFQDSIGAYFEGNYQQNSPDDLSKFVTNGVRNKPPLGAIGFGRVTLGREEFMEYAKERFAKSAIDRLLKAHVLDSRDPLFEKKSEAAYIKDSVNDLSVEFFAQSGFDEESENNDQVLDSLRDKDAQAARAQSFQLTVTDDVSGQIDLRKGGLDSNQLVERLEQSRYAHLNTVMMEDRQERALRYADWIKSAPIRLFETVSRFAIDHGLPVTSGLLDALADSVNTAANELDEESRRHIAWIERLRSYLTSDVSEAGQTAIIRPGSTPFVRAIERVGDSYRWESEMELRREAATLLREARKDLIEPLAAYIRDVYEVLEARANDLKTPEGLENDFGRWPGIDSKEVPRKYFPPSNEKMLVEPEDFPEEFDRLVKASAEAVDADSNSAASQLVLREILTTRKDGESKVVVPLIGYDSDSGWVPKTTLGGLTSSGIAQKPRFKMAKEIVDYLEMAQEWMEPKGAPFGAYLSMNITEFLDPKNSSPSVFSARSAKFVSHMTAALAASGPLVKLNSGLMQELHGRIVGEKDMTLVTPIPLTPQMESYAAVKGVIERGIQQVSTGSASADQFFSEKPATSIEFMQAMGHGVSPMVMSSVMDPIASDWTAKRATELGRSGFWQWKRARLLNEAVPFDAGSYEAVIRGWLIGRAMNQLSREDDAGLGPKIMILGVDGRTKLEFPHPLLYAGKLQPVDYLGAVMESSIMVQVMANSVGNLSPLKPYQRLIDLGGTTMSIADEVKAWILSGNGLSPDPTAGTKAITLSDGASGEDRKKALIEAVQNELAVLHKNIDKHKERIDTTTKGHEYAWVYEMPVVWEMLPEIEKAVSDIVRHVGQVDIDDDMNW